jgi:hypothetical protein
MTTNSYVDSVIMKKLNLYTNTVKISGSLNSPNITYMTLDIINNLSNFNNLNFLMSASFHPPMLLQPTLVFFNSQNMAHAVARHINSRFTLDQQHLGISRHYHSSMSMEYLQQTYDNFTLELGMCSIFCAMKGASTVHIYCDILPYLFAYLLIRYWFS